MLLMEDKGRSNLRIIQSLRKILYRRKVNLNLGLLCLIIGISFLFNLFFILSYESLLPMNTKQSLLDFRSINPLAGPMSTLERSAKALEKLKYLLASVSSSTDEPWIWTPGKDYPSVPYQPSSLSKQSAIPKVISNLKNLPQSVLNEADRVCKQLLQADEVGGKIWCKLFNRTYTDTLATTTQLLDDGSTYIITGDIDLMWLRDSR